MADFTGAIAQRYDEGLGPVIFEPYSGDVAQAVADLKPSSVLELAAGTGRLTRHLASKLGAGVSFVATDLQEGMLHLAKQKVAGVQWMTADAQDLPFGESEFDVVVNQFGIMFAKDKVQAHREAWRVLRPGGTYMLAVWADTSRNVWFETLAEVIFATLPDEPASFLGMPFSYSDRHQVEQDLRQAGFESCTYEPITKDLVADSAEAFARGGVDGTPLALALAERGVTDVEAVIQQVAERYRSAYGDSPMRSTMTAVLITAQRA